MSLPTVHFCFLISRVAYLPFFKKKRWAAAHAEAAQFVRLVKNPGAMNTEQLKSVGLVAFEGFGFFVLGEVIARGNLLGYKV